MQVSITFLESRKRDADEGSQLGSASEESETKEAKLVSGHGLN